MSSKDNLPRITPSSINDLDCAKKFHILRELNQWPPSRPNPGTQFGTAVHRILKHIYDPQIGPPPHLEDVETVARQAFFAVRYASREQRDQDIQRALGIVRCYVAQDDEEDIRGTVAVEQFASYTIQHVGEPLFIISAKLDRIIFRESTPDCLVVRDYKTTRPRLDLNEALIQLWVAKLRYPEFKRFVLEMDWIDRDGRIERDIVKSSDLKGVTLLKTAQVLGYTSRTDYPAEPGEVCNFCPLRPDCQPQGQASIELPSDFFGDDEAA